MQTNTTADFHTREDRVLYECAGIAQKKIINTVDNVCCVEIRLATSRPDEFHSTKAVKRAERAFEFAKRPNERRSPAPY